MVRRQKRTSSDFVDVKHIIESSVGEVRDHPTFRAWEREQSWTEGDLVAVNNSFMFRTNVGTIKSHKFLTVTFGGDGSFAAEPTVAEGIRINSDFKRIPSKSKRKPVCESLEPSIREELKKLGRLVFLLSGSVEDTERVEEVIEDNVFTGVVLEPQLESDVAIQDGTIRLREIGNEERVWEAVRTDLIRRSLPEPTDEFKQKLATALESIASRAHALLRLPIPTQRAPRNSVLDSIVAILNEEKEGYEESLSSCRGEQARNRESYNNMLRIAYNFAGDAITFLRLLVSICDLKPIVLWCTIGKQYNLSEAFRSLPWTRSRYKPSLASYESIIADARNRAFHRLFPFTKPIDVLLPGSALSDLRLRIFSEYSRRKENDLTYQDKEMVDLLKEFTITRERSVPTGFWVHNLRVMNSAIELFSSVNNTLRLLLAHASE